MFTVTHGCIVPSFKASKMIRDLKYILVIKNKIFLLDLFDSKYLIHWIREISNPSSNIYNQIEPSTVYRLPSTVYRLPPTVYHLPSTTYRPLSSVTGHPFTVTRHSSLDTCHPSPVNYLPPPSYRIQIEVRIRILCARNKITLKFKNILH